MKFGVWILGCWIFDFFVWKRGQGVYIVIVFTDGFLLFFSGQGGVNHFRPRKIYIFWMFCGFGFWICSM